MIEETERESEKRGAGVRVRGRGAERVRRFSQSVSSVSRRCIYDLH